MRVPWESGRGRGRISSNLDQLRPPQADKGVKREGYPGAQRLPGRLPPRLFTYEVAHGSRIGIPVTLPKRHASPREPGPGNPPPPLWGSRLHPLGVPGSSSSPKRFPGSGPRLRVLPGRCGAPRTGSRAPGRGHRGGAPGHRRTCRAPRGTDEKAALSAPGVTSGRRPRGAPGASSGPRWASRPRGGGDVPGTTAWELAISALIPPPTGQMDAFLCASGFPAVGQEIGVNTADLRSMVRITDVNRLGPCLAPTK